MVKHQVNGKWRISFGRSQVYREDFADQYLHTMRGELVVTNFLFCSCGLALPVAMKLIFTIEAR